MTATGNLQSELEALRTGAAIFPLTDRAFLRITGPDATRWLNGMVTNNIKDLAPGEGNYNFLLNAQGRIQGDCTIHREPGEGEPTFLLQTDGSQLETIHQILDRYIIMDDVELQRIAPADVDLSFLPPTLPETTPEAQEALRILSATPKFGVDITDKYLPQETAQTHALNFNKGCYLGQEIVERIHSRGQVHRTFTAFVLTGSLPTLPAPLTAAALSTGDPAKPAGELTSAMQIGDTLHALGYLRREFATAHLTYPGGSATPKLASGIWPTGI
jgi:folate-binding protein YgfZ